MNRILTIIFALLFSLDCYGQDANIDRTVLYQDSILLNNFWTEFSNAIKANDKEKLATLCEFPFYCSSCIDDTTIEYKDRITAKVTRKLFFNTVYMIFFDNPIKREVEKHREFKTSIFDELSDKRNRHPEFVFSYTIAAPSKDWDGLQGFIHINWKNGKYKITGIDTVP